MDEKRSFAAEDILEMRSPAAWHRDLYREAAPTGNGKLGALVYGGISQERIAVNHCRLWEKGKQQTLPDVHETLGLTRAAIDRGDYWGGNWFGANALKEQGYSPRLGNPVPVCDLAVGMEGRQLFRNYRRTVHMDTGEVVVSWREGENAYRRSLFVSRKNDMIFCRVESDETPFELTVAAVRHETGEDDAKKKWENRESLSFAEGKRFGFQAQHEDGLWYGALGEIRSDGATEVKKNGLTVTGATWVVVALKPEVGLAEELSGSLTDGWPEEMFDYPARKGEHATLHRALYRSAELSLSQRKDSSNEELLAAAYEEEAPAELLEKQWKFGRYLMVCGTREDGLPFPLYGLWHGRYKMSWPHNMANENVEMIYWHTLTGNLAGAMITLIRYYVDKMPQFRECATKLFGLPGIYVPAGTTPEHCFPTQIVPVILNWIGCAGWLSQMFYRYYLYTGDRELLERDILPFMLETGLFYENYVVREADGTVRIYPSVSPENTPGNLIPEDNPDMAHPCPSVENATMDIAIMKELFTNLLEVSEETGNYAEKREIWRDIIKHLPAYGVTEDGDVREWQKEGLDQRYNHRHLSHIYPLFPGTEIVRGRDSEEVVAAFEKAVGKRGLGAQTGWSLSHMACIYARLQRPEKVLECLDIMDKSCLLRNFFTLHNDWRGMGLTLGRDSFAPVQLDAAMGVVQAIQECLLFVGNDCIKLLPALPGRLGKGALKGFRYMTGSLSMEWDMAEGRLWAEMYAQRETNVKIYLPKWVKEVVICSQNQEIRYAEGDNQEQGVSGLKVHMSAGDRLEIRTAN